MRWNTYRDFLRKKYGTLVYKIGVDGGFTCPNRVNGRGCSFCDATGSVASYQRKDESAFKRNSPFDREVSEEYMGSLTIKEQIDRGKRFISSRYGVSSYALYFQSFTSTYGSIDYLRRVYYEALSYGPFKAFIVSTRPDAVPEEVLDLLSEINDEADVSVELGLESSSDETLERINRGHDLDSYFDAMERLHKRGFYVSTHVILGLPGENRENYLDTARALNRASTEGVKIHNLHIPGGTELYEDYLDGDITSPSFNRHLEDTELFLRHLNGNMIIERLTSDTPMHRLASPRDFGDKGEFIRSLEKRMEEHDTKQGDLYEAV